jgi:hypothetical protein
VRLPGAQALACPQGAGPQDAAQLPSAWQIGPVPGTQREVLRLPGQEAAQAPPGCSAASHRAAGIGDASGGLGQTAAGIGEPVVWVGPDDRLVRIGACRGDPFGEVG